MVCDTEVKVTGLEYNKSHGPYYACGQNGQHLRLKIERNQVLNRGLDRFFLARLSHSDKMSFYDRHRPSLVR